MTAILGPAAWRRNPLRWLLWTIPAALLVLPAVAMQFTPEVQWTGFDFVFAGVLLFGSAALIDLVMRKVGNWAYRLGVGLTVLTSFLLIWINGAVGIIGDEDNPLNLVYIAEILVAAGGAVIARFQPRGMARALSAATLVQAAVTVAVPVAGWGAGDPPGVIGLVMLNAVFLALWLIAAGLFANAADAPLTDS